MTAPDDFAELLEIERIKQLKARYFRLLDDRAHQELRQLFVADARILTSKGTSFDGPDAFIAFLDGLGNRPARTVHHAHMPDIVLTSPSTARGVWSLSAYAEMPPDGATGSVIRLGRYEDEYRKQDGAWKIAAQRLTLSPLKP